MSDINGSPWEQDQKEEENQKQEPIVDDKGIVYQLKEWKPSSTKYYMCNFCKNINLVTEKDIRSMNTPHNPKDVRDVHMIVDKELHSAFKKFSVSFGGYEGALLVL